MAIAWGCPQPLQSPPVSMEPPPSFTASALGGVKVAEGSPILMSPTLYPSPTSLYLSTLQPLCRACLSPFSQKHELCSQSFQLFAWMALMGVKSGFM